MDLRILVCALGLSALLLNNQGCMGTDCQHGAYVIGVEGTQQNVLSVTSECDYEISLFSTTHEEREFRRFEASQKGFDIKISENKVEVAQKDNPMIAVTLEAPDQCFSFIQPQIDSLDAISGPNSNLWKIARTDCCVENGFVYLRVSFLVSER